MPAWVNYVPSWTSGHGLHVLLLLVGNKIVHGLGVRADDVFGRRLHTMQATMVLGCPRVWRAMMAAGTS